MSGIYDWEHPSGYLAFLADSTWGLLGTSLGNIVQVCNIIGGAKYRDDLSHRQNRNVYENGIYIAKDDAFTQGNVISNAIAGGKTIDMSLINNHESLHILQNCIFLPHFPGRLNRLDGRGRDRRQHILALPHGPQLWRYCRNGRVFRQSVGVLGLQQSGLLAA
jgi:hypothetical protein